MEIRGKAQAFDTNEKRFYLPGFEIVGKCPACGTGYERDMASEYLSYPTANQPCEVTCYCGNCEHEWPIKVILRITLELACADGDVDPGVP